MPSSYGDRYQLEQIALDEYVTRFIEKNMKINEVDTKFIDIYDKEY